MPTTTPAALNSTQATSNGDGDNNPISTATKTEHTECIIGIDLGTTNSLAAVVRHAEAQALRTHPQASPIIPSVLWRTNNQWVVGEDAKAERTKHPEHVVYSVKRLLGRGVNDLANDIASMPYRIEAGVRGTVQVSIDDQRFTPQELSAEILKAVKMRAESALGHSITKAVITTPAYFDDAQRQATRDAAKLAGLDAVRIINEPTAAALAYGLDTKQRGLIAVYDLGGGTFDISILSLKDRIFRVLATHGDTHLGGDDADALIAQVLKAEVAQQCPQYDMTTPVATQLFKKTAELIKMDLSHADQTPWQMTFEEGVEARGVFSAEQMNTLLSPVVERTLAACQKALDIAKKQADEIDEVVLVGGSTRLPLIRKQVEIFFGKAPNLSLDPDEVVALGAAVQGAILAGQKRDLLLLDVIPLALGIETLGGAFHKLIIGNTTIPASAQEIFSTYVDNQTGVDINIYQGERELVENCRHLGRFKLKGLPLMPAGLPRVRVSFTVNANGLLAVSALEERSQTQAQIDITPSHGLTKDEIERMMDDAIASAEEDFRHRQLVEFRNTAQAVLRGIKQAWPQAKNLLSHQQQQAMQTQANNVAQAAKGQDPYALKHAMDALGQLTQPLADDIMSAAALKALKS